VISERARKVAVCTIVGIVAATASLAVGPAGAETSPEGDVCYVAASYEVFLGRGATTQELTWWAGLFDAGQARSRLANDLARSDEWLGVEVAKLYLAALDREPDAAGSAFWVDQLRSGVLVNRVGSLIYGSGEFYARAGGTPEGFVTDIYTRILGRTPDPGGMGHWLGQIDRLGRGRVASLFFASLESRTNRVHALYEQILDRAPDAAGLAHWVGQLVTVNDVRLAVLLASSTEFYDRAQPGCSGVPVTSRVTDGDDDSSDPSISLDGRHVAFSSAASDLVPGDVGGIDDVFTWDRTTGTTTRVTDGNDGSYEPSISADGRYVAFASFASDLVAGDTNAAEDVFVWDRTTGTTTRVTDGDGGSFDPSISGDGRLVAFTSAATDLVPGDVGGRDDVFVWHRTTGTTARITDGDDDSHDPSISADGTSIAFSSWASDLAPGDTNSDEDVFVWTRSTGTTTRLTTGNHFSREPSISGDGSSVAFSSFASNLVPGDTNGDVDVFVWERATGATTRITDGRDGVAGSVRPSMSGDGRFTSFSSDSAGVVPGDAGGVHDAFVWDRITRKTTRIASGDGDSEAPSASGDGRYVAFMSAASDLVVGDVGGAVDVFVWDHIGA
jgi:Tol biopolymer transport system component